MVKFNGSGLAIDASHRSQYVRSSESGRASIWRRRAPKRTGIPTWRAEKGNVSAEAESCSPLGTRGAWRALSARTKSPGKVILAAARKTLWTTPRCAAPATGAARQSLYDSTRTGRNDIGTGRNERSGRNALRPYSTGLGSLMVIRTSQRNSQKIKK